MNKNNLLNDENKEKYNLIEKSLRDDINEDKDTYLSKTLDFLYESQNKNIDLNDLNLNPKNSISNEPLSKTLINSLKYIPTILLLSTLPTLLVKAFQNGKFNNIVNFDFTPIILIDIVLYILFITFLVITLRRKATLSLSYDSKQEMREFIKIYVVVILFLLLLALLHIFVKPNVLVIMSFSINIILFILALTIIQVVTLYLLKDK